MRPLLIGGGLALLGIGAYFAFSGDSHPANADAVPAGVVKLVADALATGDPATMKQVAAKLRSQGYTLQASSLEDAASELASAIRKTPATTPGKALAAPKQTLSKMTAQRLPNPAPAADSAPARQQAGRLAQLLSSMTPDAARKSPQVTAAVRDYQSLEKSRGFYQGNLDGLYGPKTALTLAEDHGIVPPEPLLWPKKNMAQAQQLYTAQLARFAAADPQRREEWAQAMHTSA